MGRQPRRTWEGGGFDELMHCDSARILWKFLYYTDHSMSSRHVLIFFAVVACAQGGVKYVTYGRKR